MADYHVGYGAFGIYAGTLNRKNKNLWQSKTECTDEAINAVRDWMINDLLGVLIVAKERKMLIYGNYKMEELLNYELK